MKILVRKISIGMLLLSISISSYGQYDTSINSKTVWTLQSCIERAWNANVTIQRNSLDRNLSQLEVERVKARLNPNLFGSASQGLSQPIGNQSGNTRHSTNIGLSSDITLFNGFNLRNRIEQSKISALIANNNLQFQRNLISSSIANLYLQVMLNYENIGIIANQLTQTRALIKQTQAKIDFKQVAPIQIYSIKARLAQEISDSLTYANNISYNKLQIMQLMEIPYRENFKIEKLDIRKLLLLIPNNSTEIYNKALGALPEIVSSKEFVNFYKVDKEIQRANYFPMLSLSGNLGTNYSSSIKKYSLNPTSNVVPVGYLQSNPSQLVVKNEFIQNAENYSLPNQFTDNIYTGLSLNLSIPIYNRKNTNINLKKANINVEIASLDLKNKQYSIRKEIENTFLAYRQLQKQQKANIDRVEANKLSYKSALKQYELGWINAYNLLEEKNKVFSAELQLKQINYQLLYNEILLNYYMSGVITLKQNK